MKMKSLLKNLLLATAPLAAAATVLAAPEAEDGFKSIFNGKDLTGWDGDPKFWSVKEGAITGQTTADNPTKGNTFLIWRQGLVDDFQLRFSYRTVPGSSAGFCNSGVQYRSKDRGNWVVHGYQADIEAGKTYSGILYEEGGRGILAQRGQRTVIDPSGKVTIGGSVGNSDEIQAGIKNGEWNEYVILAQGNHLAHIINGRLTVDVTDQQADKRAFSGILALQAHAGEPMMVQFKDIRLKRLKDPGTKRIVFVAGGASHGPGDHEHNAGCRLLKKCLDNVPRIRSVVYENGWPKDSTAFDNADAIVIFSDGGDGHPAIQGNNLQTLAEAMKKGVGLGCLHYAVEVPKNRGGRELLDWIGGYFETFWSVNPFWDAEFKEFPKHPIANGVKPFKMRDEWYYHMRFPEGMKGVTPILSAVPPDSTRGKDGANDAHGGNPEVQKHKGEPEHVMWAYERPDGGRGFGFTGGHAQKNWGNDEFRRVVLNAILWIAKKDVPEEGVQSIVSEEELTQNLDPKGK